MMRISSYLAVLVIGTSLAVGADSQLERAARTQAELKSQREKALQCADELDASLTAYGLASPDIAAARKTLDAMMQQRDAWRSLTSRTTKTREAARASLEHYLRTARTQVAVAEQKLALIKKAEFEEWAKANPGAAKIVELEQRTKKAEAEAAAKNAEDESLIAQGRAEDAQRAAAQAQRDADAALEKRAKPDPTEELYRQLDADKLRRAEEALRRNGICP